MASDDTAEVVRKYPFSAAYIRSRIPWSERLDSAGLQLSREATAVGDEAVWTVSVPIREQQHRLFGVLSERNGSMLPIDRMFCKQGNDLTPEFMAMLDRLAGTSAAEAVNFLKDAADLPEFQPNSVNGLLLGFNTEWSGGVPRDICFSLRDRQKRDLYARAAAREYALAWQPDGFTGNGGDVTSLAKVELQRRRSEFPWVEISSDTSEFASLLSFFQNSELDFELPLNLMNSNVSISRKKLSFYKHYNLYEIFDRRSARPRHTRFLFAPNELASPDHPRLIPMYSSANLIHQHNQRLNLLLSDDQLVEYTVFFCDQILGAGGSTFSLLERVEDAQWHRHMHGADVRASFATIVPLRLWPEQEPNTTMPPTDGGNDSRPTSFLEQIPKGTRLVDGLTRHGKAIFHASFLVTLNGFVQMASENLLLLNSPARTTYLDDESWFLLKPVDQA